MKLEWDKVKRVDSEAEMKSKQGGWLIGELERRLKGGMNFMAAVAGDTGSGKSYTTMRICQLLSKRLGVPFSVDNIVFDPNEFFTLLGNSQFYTCFMVDESGLTLDAHKWQSVINRLFSYVAETFRFKRLAVFFVLPDLSFLDSRCRRVTHAFIRVHQPYGREARVYKLASNHLGEQWLKGMGKLVNVRLPDYENCKKGSCGDCSKFRTHGINRCMLLRAEYERKKEEAFETLRLYIQMELDARSGQVISPYNPMGSQSGGGDLFINEKNLDNFVIDHTTPKPGQLSRNSWGSNVLNEGNVLNKQGIVEEVETKRKRGRPRIHPKPSEIDEDKVRL